LNKNKIIQTKSTQNKIAQFLKYNNPLLVSNQQLYADSDNYRNGFKLIKRIFINKSVEISQNPSNLCPNIEF